MPSLMVAGCIAFAAVLIEAESTGRGQWLMNEWPRMFGVEAEGARQMLSTLAGSMMTVMGVIFSMTLLALVMASGQYTSRILRNFMRSRITQFTLGTFAGIFAYCLIVLRTIRGSGGVAEFVPNLAVFFAFLFSLCGVGILIYFIHHIASSIQASSIIAAIAQETNASIDRLLPDQQQQAPDEDEGLKQGLEALDARVWYPVPVAKSGYIQSVDHAALLRLSRQNRTIARMEHGIGAFVVQDRPLLSLALTYAPDQETMDAYHAAYSVGHYRTVEQDPTFGIRQIVDIAIKALSPGINDTSTAIMCVDYLTSIMARLASRQFPPEYRYEGETLRVVVIVPNFEDLLTESFDQIRSNAEVNVAILLRLLGALDTIGSLTLQPENLRALKAQLQCIAELSERCIKSSYEHARLGKRLAEVRKTLQTQTALAVEG